MPKLCPHLILEGTRLTHKTDLAFALNRHPRVVGPRKYEYHSPLVSGEWCAFTNHPWGRGLINFAPEEEPLAMETYRAWVHLIELQRFYSWIIDRFHLSTQLVQQQLHGRHYDFGWLEDRLRPLNFRIILCTRHPDSFEAARAERLKVSGSPSQYDDLTPFLRDQDVLRDLATASSLPVFEIDVSDDDVPRAADAIADWLAATDGLTMPDVPHPLAPTTVTP
ncbi:MAG: hypothetical protein AAGG50_16635 [Bacteroidota bacterium]